MVFFPYIKISSGSHLLFGDWAVQTPALPVTSHVPESPCTRLMACGYWWQPHDNWMTIPPLHLPCFSSDFVQSYPLKQEEARRPDLGLERIKFLHHPKQMGRKQESTGTLQKATGNEKFLISTTNWFSRRDVLFSKWDYSTLLDTDCMYFAKILQCVPVNSYGIYKFILLDERHFIKKFLTSSYLHSTSLTYPSCAKSVQERQGSFC